MKSKTTSRLRVWLSYGVATVCIAAVGIGLWHGFRGKSVVAAPAKADRPSLTAEVTLANRTLCATGFPVRFSEHQSVSARQTAPYVVMLAEGVRKGAAIAAIRDCGARVIGPLPPKALLVEASAFALGKMSTDPHFAAASEWLPEDKVDARLRPLIEAGGEALDVTVVTLASADVAVLAELASQKGGERVEGCLNGKSSITLTLPRAVVMELAKRGDVRWIEPFARPKLLNDKAVGQTAMNAQMVWETWGLTGEGQLVTTSDSGIDTGDLDTMHADLRNRVVGFKVANNTCYTYDKNGHGTHTAGSIVGDGTCSDGQIRGTAHRAKLWAWFCGGKDGYIYTPENCHDLFRPTGATNACIHSASWGNDDEGVYNQGSRDMDEYVWEHPDFLPVIANGNAGSSAQTVGSPATAKNVLSVGATQNARTGGDRGWGNGDPTKVAQFSSRGPCADGRIKPDVCAPGIGIVSTRAYGCSYIYGIYSNTNYAYDCGTSMATPLTAGAAALVREWLVERRGFTNAVPTAALVKAVLMGGARNALTPDNTFGWGCVDLGESLYPSNRAVRLVDRVPYFSGIDGVACEVTLTNAAPLDVQLVWIDYPGTAGTAKTLVNDLDLIVSNKTTGAVWYGNAIVGGDRTNNVESVRIASAAPGDYAVIVRGYDITYESAQGGAAAVYVRGAFEGENESEKTLAILASEPAGERVVMTVGETNVFQVTVSASTNVTPAYAWTVDGVTVAGATTNRFVYGTTWADHGRHLVRVIVRAPGGLLDSRSWTVVVRGEVHVDAATGDDATATGAAERPYATIAAALAKSVAGDVLRVGAGAYAGGLVVPANDVRIESAEGPEMTVIDGGGTNRCFDATAYPTAVLAGFTLTNGWVDASNDDDYGAGALYGWLTNCVITGCRVEGYGYGGGAADSTLIDCVVERCCGDYVGGGLYKCTASCCLIRENETYYSNSRGGGAVDSTLMHCTVYGNVSGESAGGVDGNCVCTNSIVWGNELFNGETSNWEAQRSYGRTYRTKFTFSCTTPTGYSDGGGNTNNTPRWVDAPNGDFRLAVKSPCLGSANDGLNMGRWQGTAVQGCVLKATTEGPGEIEPAETFVEEGQTATFTATTHHPFFGWTTNGVAAADASTNVFIWTDVRADGAIVASFGTTNFYVDAVCGNDASNGWSWAEAKRSLQAAVVVARDGEIVAVNPGVYAGAVEATISSIDIVSVGGPTVTFIDGGGTNRCYDGYANQATRLRGFTLVNGASTNNYGGGVLFGTLSNCVIRNCFAKSGGGGACIATLTDCVIAGCRTDEQGGGASNSTLVNCTVCGNQAGSWRSYYSRYYDCDYGGGIDYVCECTNTIVWGNCRKDGTADNWESYLYASGRYLYEASPSLFWCCTTPLCRDGSNCLTNDPLFASSEVGDPRLYEISPCIAAGKGGVNIGAYRGTGVVKALPSIDVKTVTGEEVSNAVASVGYVDPSVQRGIGTNAATYAAFQAWSTNGLKSTAVVFSTRAYDSFLVREIVAAPTLLGEGNKTSVKLTALEPTSDGTCSTTVRLVDGETEIPLCSVKAAFAKHTQVGTDPCALHQVDPANVEATSVDDGKAVRLTITPPESTLRYFMRFVIQ